MMNCFHFAELTKSKPIVVRFIELMPFDSKQIWKKLENSMGQEEIIGELKNHFPNMSTATELKQSTLFLMCLDT